MQGCDSRRGYYSPRSSRPVVSNARTALDRTQRPSGACIVYLL